MSDITTLMMAAAGQAGEESDDDFASTVLLLHGDGTNGAQNNTFLDSSTNNFTITRNGSTTQGTFSPFSKPDGAWANYFSGSSDYFSSSTALFNYTTANASSETFTIEAWVYHNARTSPANAYWNQAIVGKGDIYLNFGISGSGLLMLYHFDGTQRYTYSTAAIPLGVWTHVAAVVTGGTTALYINGSADGTGTWYGLAAAGQNTTSWIGRPSNNASSNYFDGYISNLRVSNNVRSISTPTSPYSDDGNTVLLTCQSNRFIDNSSNAYALTAVGTPKATPFSPFPITTAYDPSVNGGAGYFDGSGDYLTLADNAALNLDSGDFTVQCWFYALNTTSIKPLVVRFNGNATGRNDLQFFITINAGSLQITPYLSTTDYTMSFANLSANAFHHCALVRTGNNFYAYLDGVRNATTQTISGSLNNNTWETWIGGYREGGTFYYQNGYIAAAQIIKGTALYTGATYTVPSLPPTAIANTSLLCNFTNAGIYDNTGFNVLETVGNAQIDTTTKKYGTGSMEFDGTGDWLKVPNSPDLQLGTGNFTIEFWVYLASGDTGSARGLVAKGGASTGWLVSLDSSEKVVFTYTTSTITSSGAITTNAWNHIAVVREGTGSNETKIYIGGTNDGTGTVSTDFNQTEVMYIGANRAAGDPMKGFIDDLRISRVARYTTTFTPPTKAFPNIGS